MLKICFICTSQKDRSPALEKYFHSEFPQHEYRSAGINKFHCTNKGTHYIEQADIEWADLLVFCELIHKDVVIRNFIDYDNMTFQPETMIYRFTKRGEQLIDGFILGLGQYEKGNITNDYLSRAKEKLKKILQ